jgi:threonine synthase
MVAWISLGGLLRYWSVTFSVARALGHTGVVESSPGNLGISVGVYATAAGLCPLILYPPDIPVTFLYLTALYGGKAAVMSWHRRAPALGQARRRRGWYIVDGTNPFGLEGYKIIAYEIVRDFGHSPNCVFLPLGSGQLFTGVFRGFSDLVMAGFTDRLPKLIGCRLPASMC